MSRDQNYRENKTIRFIFLVWRARLICFMGRICCSLPTFNTFSASERPQETVITAGKLRMLKTKTKKKNINSNLLTTRTNYVCGDTLRCRESYFHYLPNRYHLLFFWFLFLKLIRAILSIFSKAFLLPRFFRNPHNGAPCRKRKLLPQAYSQLWVFVFNKASLLIQRMMRSEESRRKKVAEEKKKGSTKESQSSLEFRLIRLWGLSGGGKKEINYGAHLNMISSTRPLPVPWKTKLLSKLIACCSRSGIKENNQAGLD